VRPSISPTSISAQPLSAGNSENAAAAAPPLPVASLLFPAAPSASAADTLAALSNGPTAEIVALTVIVAFAPEASVAIVQ